MDLPSNKASCPSLPPPGKASELAKGENRVWPVCGGPPATQSREPPSGWGQVLGPGGEMEKGPSLQMLAAQLAPEREGLVEWGGGSEAETAH